MGEPGEGLQPPLRRRRCWPSPICLASCERASAYFGATIQAETESVLYELAADDYETIKREQPALSQALLAYVVAVMAERLSFANRLVGVLQR